MHSPLDSTRSAEENLRALRDGKHIYLVNTGPRDTGQSDFKNRLMFQDMIQLAPKYEAAGYVAVELHGGARFHQDLMHNRINPYKETLAWKQAMRHTLTQTLIRSTNVFGYRAYPKNVIRETVESCLPTIDIWRCFDFLNHIPNMVPAGEAVLEGGGIWEPAISYTESDDTTDAYYLGVTKEIIDTFGGQKNLILAIKDMAGVGSPARIHRLVDAMLQRWPDLIINYHRHSTDGLGVPAVVEAARAGAKMIDVTDDAFSRFYGQPPVQAVVARMREVGLEPYINDPVMVDTSHVVRSFIGNYDEWESPFKGFAYDVTDHRMPGGAFPSSFEQAEKGGFLELMPQVLRGMGLGNKMIKYFDVTPGSQVTWTTWAAIVQRVYKDDGLAAVNLLLDMLQGFIAGGQDVNALSVEDRELLLTVYSGATDDLKSLVLGGYGPLPFGWPADWVYESIFGSEWRDRVAAEREDVSRALELPDEDMDAVADRLETEIGRRGTYEELMLYVAHPPATVEFIQFREKYGDTTSLPSNLWFKGLHDRGDAVDFEMHGRPHRLEMVSIGSTGPDGKRPVTMMVDNQLMVFDVAMPDAVTSSAAVRYAGAAAGEIGATVKGNLWRIGSRTKPLAVGDEVAAGEEVANLEVMKTENAVFTTIAGTVTEIAADKNAAVDENQLLIVIEPA